MEVTEKSPGDGGFAAVKFPLLDDGFYGGFVFTPREAIQTIFRAVQMATATAAAIFSVFGNGTESGRVQSCTSSIRGVQRLSNLWLKAGTQEHHALLDGHVEFSGELH